MAKRLSTEGGPWQELPIGALVLVDSAPLIYVLEDHPRFASRFLGLFESEAAGDIQIAMSTIALAEVLCGPFAKGEEALASRYIKAFQAFVMVPVTADIAETAARMRARYRLKLPDAMQLATALEIGAVALVTHDRDFSAVDGIRIIDGG